MAFEAAHALDRHGYIDDELFAQLRDIRPRRQSDIDRVCRQFERSPVDSEHDVGHPVREGDQPQPQRWRWYAMLAGVAVLSVIITGFGIGFGLIDTPRPDHTAVYAKKLPAGLVVITAKEQGTSIDSPTRETFLDLCDAVKRYAPQAATCHELPPEHTGTKALLEAATRPALIARIDHHHEVRLLLAVDDEVGLMSRMAHLAPALRELPSIRAPSPAQREQVAKVLVGIAQVLAGDSAATVAPLPALRTADVGWRWAALVWVLGGSIDVSEARRAMEQCLRDTSAADWYCAASHYAVSLSCPSCGDMDGVLTRLLHQGPSPYRTYARIALARRECSLAPQKAIVELSELDNEWDVGDCRRVALFGVAGCVMAASRDNTFEYAQTLAYPDGLETCDARARATAIAERGQWAYRRQQWQQAEEDWEQAWLLDGRASSLLNWAEALLRQRHTRAEDVKRLLSERMTPASLAPELQVHAAFLRWLGTMTLTDARELQRHYRAVHLGEYAVNPSYLPAELVCTGREDNKSDVGCRVYNVLTELRAPDSDEKLEALLGQVPSK